MCRHLDRYQAVKGINAHLLMIQTADILVTGLGLNWLMVAEMCCGNCIKDAMVFSGKCGFGRFFGKILVALKKLCFSTIFPDFRHIHITHQYPSYIYYITYDLFGDPCQVPKMP